MKRLISLVLCLILVASLAAISASANNEVTVTCHTPTNDGVDLVSVAYLDYGSEFYPSAPRTLKLNDGRVFGGWYKDTDYTIRYSKGRVYSSFDLYARYVEEDEIVVFAWFLDGLDIAPAGSATYVAGDVANYPPEPAREGMVFMGWYADSKYTRLYDFSDPLEKNTFVYARFAEEDDIVYIGYYLEPDDEFPVGSGMYVRGDYPVQPASPDQEGKTFLGWYADKYFYQEFDFTQPVYSDENIYARLVPDEDLVYLGIYRFYGSEEPVAHAMYERGDYPSQPAEPGEEGKVFIGWYTDWNFTELFDFNKPLTENTGVYARLVDEQDVVKVNYHLGSGQNDLYLTQTYAKGDTPFEPDDPDPDYDNDKFFYGWYADKNLTVPFDFSKSITKDTDVYAKYVGGNETYNVFIYLTADATEALAGYSRAKGRPYYKPADRGEEGYVFEGWFTDRALTIPADYESPCYNDVHLYPKLVKEPDNHTKLRYVAARPTAIADGVQEHLECEVCGKWFTYNTPAQTEIIDHEELVIDALGPYVCGDTDGDNDVSVLDATSIQRRLASLNNEGTFCRGASDTDGDGILTILDATDIQRHLADLPTAGQMIGQTIRRQQNVQ